MLTLECNLVHGWISGCMDGFFCFSGSLIAVFWVSDSQQPFVERRRNSPDVLYLKKKQALVIPCRVTHPNITTTLVKVSAQLEVGHTICRLLFNKLVSVLCDSVGSCVPPPQQVSRYPVASHSLWTVFHIVLGTWQAVATWRVCVFVPVCFTPTGGYV